MDTSKTYIKMCEKATEVQESHKWEYGDWFISEYGLWQIGTACFNYDMSDKTKPPVRSELPVATMQDDDGEVVLDDIIWLPRQDQLQAMVGCTACNLGWFYRWASSEVYDLPNDAENFVFTDHWYRWTPKYFNCSWEQLWHAFVVKEKYGKSWSGEDWVKLE